MTTNTDAIISVKQTWSLVCITQLLAVHGLVPIAAIAAKLQRIRLTPKRIPSVTLVIPWLHSVLTVATIHSRGWVAIAPTFPAVLAFFVPGHILLFHSREPGCLRLNLLCMKIQIAEIATGISSRPRPSPGLFVPVPGYGMILVIPHPSIKLRFIRWHEQFRFKKSYRSSALTARLDLLLGREVSPNSSVISSILLSPCS